MSTRQVADVNEIAQAGSVAGRVIGAVHGQWVAESSCGPNDQRNQVGFRRMVFAEFAIRVGTRGVVRRADVASGTAMIVLDATGQNQIVVANGANDTLIAADVQAQRDLFAQSKAVVVQLETPLPSVEATLRLARECRVPAILNPAPFAPVGDALLHLCDWIIPNENESAKLSGTEVRDAPSAASAAVAIKLRSACPRVLLTLGANGVWLDTPEFTGHVPGFKVQAVDTVGAGDTFIGAFVARLIEGAAFLMRGYFFSSALIASSDTPCQMVMIPSVTGWSSTTS